MDATPTAAKRQTPFRLYGTRRPLQVVASDSPDIAAGDVYTFQGNSGPYGPWTRGRNGGTSTADFWGWNSGDVWFSVWASGYRLDNTRRLPRNHSLPVGIYTDGTYTLQLSF